MGYKNFTLVEQKLPKNGIIKNYTHRKPIAPLKIITPNYQFPRYGTIHNENFYIKLIDSTSGRLAVTIFVRPGSSFEIAVPTGVYEMRYASGKTWYGEKDLFGPETSYNKSDNLLSFLDKGYYLQGQSLTLYKTPNGNLSTQEIDASDF